MNKKIQKLITTLTPYIICQSNQLGKLNSSSYKHFENLKYYDPLKTESQWFIEHIYKMDELTFGGQEMGMPKWVFFDCSVMPGIVFGYGIERSLLPIEDQKLFSSEHDFIPLSMYIAIPTMNDGEWFGHNLSSLNKILTMDLSGLGLMTKYFAMKIANIKKLIGATQWDSNALHIHLQLSNLKIKSAYTPIHTKKETLCYESSLLSEEKVFSSDRSSHLNLVEINQEYITELQKKVENGVAFEIQGRPLIKDGKRYLSIKEI